MDKVALGTRFTQEGWPEGFFGADGAAEWQAWNEWVDAEVEAGLEARLLAREPLPAGLGRGGADALGGVAEWDLAGVTF